MSTTANSPKGLELLRKPFEPHQISKLPKPTKKQTDEVKADYKKGIRCKDCGAWHHPDVIHLDYVGHAALTDRLLDCDLYWHWEPLAFDEKGLPRFDENGGLWIKLTICGQTRLGYGNAQHSDSKEVGSREKEVIGDALRNAAMRFGAALELWHKGDLHKDKEEVDEGANTEPKSSIQAAIERKKTIHAELEYKIRAAESNDDFPTTSVTTNPKSTVPTQQKKDVRIVPVAEIVKLTSFIKSKGRTEAWLTMTVKTEFNLTKLTDLTLEQIEKIKEMA